MLWMLILGEIFILLVLLIVPFQKIVKEEKNTFLLLSIIGLAKSYGQKILGPMQLEVELKVINVEMFLFWEQHQVDLMKMETSSLFKRSTISIARVNLEIGFVARPSLRLIGNLSSPTCPCRSCTTTPTLVWLPRR